VTACATIDGMLRRHRIPHRLRAATILAVTVALAAATGAQAARIDSSSDQTALTTYHTYVSALANATATARQTDETFIGMVDSHCANVLQPLSSLSSSQLSQPVLVDFGTEIGADLSLEFHRVASKPFTRLAQTLGALRWSSPASTRTISGLISAVRASLAIAPSSLCTDARALVANPQTEPAGTRSFLATYLPATSLAKQRLAPFLKLLAKYQSASDSSVIKSIDTLVDEFSAASAAETKTDTNTIVSDLGLSS